MDTPAKPDLAAPAPDKKKLPFEPWMIAAAVGLGVGVVLGLRVAQLMRPPALPSRLPCPDCERRKAQAAMRAPAVRVPAPPVVAVEDDTPRPFSAQAIPEPDPLADAEVGDFEHENLPDD